MITRESIFEAGGYVAEAVSAGISGDWVVCKPELKIRGRAKLEEAVQVLV